MPQYRRNSVINIICILTLLSSSFIPVYPVKAEASRGGTALPIPAVQPDKANFPHGSPAFDPSPTPSGNIIFTELGELAVDRDGNSMVSPGDRLRYTLSIQNDTSDDLTDLVVEEPINPVLTLAADTVNSLPLAFDQSISVSEDTPSSFNLEAYDADPGDALTYVLTDTSGLNGSLDISALPDVIYTPTSNYYGSAYFTFQVCDDGTSGVCPVVSSPITGRVDLTITALNDPPSFISGSNQIINEGSGSQIIPNWASAISAGPADELGQTLTFQVSTNNDAFFDVLPAISSNGTLTYTPNADASGIVTVSVVLKDDGGGDDTSPAQTFTITINPENDPPTLDALSDLNILEDAGVQTVSLSGISSGTPFEDDTLIITASSSNPALIPNPAILYTSPDSSGQLTFSSTADLSGSALITVVIDDGQADNHSLTRTFQVNVAAVNDAPLFSVQSTLTLTESDPEQTIQITGIGSGASNENQVLSLTVVSSNPSLIPTPSITYTSPASTASMTFTPVSGSSGTSVLTITLDDGGTENHATTHTLTVTVNAVNDAPNLDAISDLTINEDAGIQTVNLSGIDSGSPLESETLTITASSSNPALIADPSVVYTSPEPTGSLLLTPTADANGSADITVTISDGQPVNSTLVRTFTITVQSVNDAPHMNILADLNLDEDAPQQTVTLSGIDTGAANESDTLTITATSSNTVLIPDPEVEYTSPASTGQIRFTPVANASGTAVISVTVSDGQAVNPSLTRTFTVTVAAVNDTPQISGGSVTLDENSANATLVTTAAYSDPDVGQTHTFSITGGNTLGAFSIDSSGQILVADSTVLDYETNPIFNLTVQITDDGTPAASASATFTVSLNNIDEAPTVLSESYQTIGNTLLQVDDTQTAAQPSIFVNGNLLSNDSDPEGATPLTISLVSATSGASVSLAGDGSFTYVPPAGQTGSDSFTYQVSDLTGHSSQGTVTISLVNQVWYVKNDASAGGTGVSTAPFDTLAEASAASLPGDTIYVFAGNGTTSGQNQGITLQANQRLIGSGAVLSVSGSVNGGSDPTVLLSAGTSPQVSNDNSGGNAVTVENLASAEIQGLTLSGAANAVDATYTGTTTGNLTIANVTVASSGEEGIDINSYSTEAVAANLSGLTISAAGDGLDAYLAAAGSLTLDLQNIQVLSGVNGIQLARSGSGGQLWISQFSSINISGAVTGIGIDTTYAIFDAVPGGTYDTVQTSEILAGSNGNATGGAAMNLTSAAGDLEFGTLALYGGSGAALTGSSSSAYTTSTGLRLTSAGSTGILESSGGPALQLSTITIDFALHHILGSAGSYGLNLAGVAGTLSDHAGGGSQISATTTAGVYLNNSTLSLSYNGTINNTLGYSVTVSNQTNGTLNFNGAITGSGTGISLTSNTGSTINFTGGLALSSGGSNSGLVATNGGSLSVTGSNNTISTLTGVALKVSGVTIAASGLTFRSISASGSASGGIYLYNTGSTGGLTITGDDTTPGSGGTLASMSGTTSPVYASSTQNLSLSYLTINSQADAAASACTSIDASACTSAINLVNAANVTLNQINITSALNTGISAQSVNGLTITNTSLSNIGDDNDEFGLLIVQPQGNTLIQDVSINTFIETGLRLYASTSTANVTLRRLDLVNNAGSYGEDGIQVEITGSASANMLVDDVDLSSLLQNGIDAVVSNTGQLHLTVQNSQIHDNQGGGIVLGGTDSSTLRASLTGNTLANLAATAVNLVSGSSAHLDAILNNNTINGVSAGYGVRLSQEEDSLMKASLSGNQINGTADSGLVAFGRLSDYPSTNGTTGYLYLSATTNTITSPTTLLTPAAIVKVQDAENTLCLKMTGNVFTGNNETGLYLDQLETGEFQIEGLVGANVDGYTAADTLDSLNSITDLTIADALVGFQGVSVGTCLQPESPNPSLASADSGRMRGLAAPRALDVQVGPVAPSAQADTSTVLSRTFPLLPAGKTITIVYEVDIAAEVAEGLSQIVSQSSMTYTVSGSPSPDNQLSDDGTGGPTPQPTTIDLYVSPVAHSDSYSTAEEVPLVVAAPGILANDLVSFGNPLTASLVGGPNQGSLVLNGDGSFTYTPSENQETAVTFSYQANDGFSSSATALVSISVNPVNDAPVLDSSASYSLTPITINQFDNEGTRIADLLNSSGSDGVTDPDTGALEGIALVGVDETHGTWQYSLDGGVSWNGVGTVSNTTALLLSADAARLRMVPESDWSGDVTDGIAFRAWDRSTGTEGATANTSVNGGTSPFSSVVANASIQVVNLSDLTIQDLIAPVQAISGTTLTVSMVVTNKGVSLVSDTTVSSVLPEGASLISASSSCTTNGTTVSCELGSLAVGQSQDLSLTLGIDPAVYGKMTLSFSTASSIPELTPEDNTASVSTRIIPGQVIYNLPDEPGSEWNNALETTSPSGTTFMGEYGNETVTLNLSGLPEHNTVVVNFVLYILRSWDGNIEGVANLDGADWLFGGQEIDTSMLGPDIWQLTGDGTTMLHTTFCNYPSQDSSQAYPDAYPGGSYIAQTGAERINSLGFTFDGINMDSTYRMQLTLSNHTASTLTLNFSAEGLQTLIDESWGLSDVSVIVTGGGELQPYKFYVPYVGN